MVKLVWQLYGINKYPLQDAFAACVWGLDM